MYGDVECISGFCHNDAYYVGQDSFMNLSESPVGAVNERYTCCTYQVRAKSMPEYCSVFDFSANYLFDYCKNNDYQKYGSINYDPAPSPIASVDYMVDESIQFIDEYIQLDMSTLVEIHLDSGSWSTNIGGRGVFHYRNVVGDYHTPEHAAAESQTEIYQVTITFSNSKEKVFLFGTTKVVRIPPLENGFPGSKSQVSVPRQSLDLALDTSGEKIMEVTVMLLTV